MADFAPSPGRSGANSPAAKPHAQIERAHRVFQIHVRLQPATKLRDFTLAFGDRAKSAILTHSLAARVNGTKPFSDKKRTTKPLMCKSYNTCFPVMCDIVCLCVCVCVRACVRACFLKHFNMLTTIFWAELTGLSQVSSAFLARFHGATSRMLFLSLPVRLTAILPSACVLAESLLLHLTFLGRNLMFSFRAGEKF